MKKRHQIALLAALFIVVMAIVVINELPNDAESDKNVQTEAPPAKKQSAATETPEGYTIVSHQELGDTTATKNNLTVLKHTESGCYYTLATNVRGTAFTQMFHNNGMGNIPYCD